MLVPATQSTPTPPSSKASRTPMCAIARAPPPLRTSPTRGGAPPSAPASPPALAGGGAKTSSAAVARASRRPAAARLPPPDVLRPRPGGRAPAHRSGIPVGRDKLRAWLRVRRRGGGGDRRRGPDRLDAGRGRGLRPRGRYRRDARYLEEQGRGLAAEGEATQVLLAELRL